MSPSLPERDSARLARLPYQFVLSQLWANRPKEKSLEYFPQDDWEGLSLTRAQIPRGHQLQSWTPLGSGPCPASWKDSASTSLYLICKVEKSACAQEVGVQTVLRCLAGGLSSEPKLSSSALLASAWLLNPGLQTPLAPGQASEAMPCPSQLLRDLSSLREPPREWRVHSHGPRHFSPGQTPPRG